MDALKLNLKIQYALGVLLTLFLVLMLLKDPSDSNTDIFAFILHFPFIIALCLYNGIALRLSKKLIEKWFYFYIPISFFSNSRFSISKILFSRRILKTIYFKKLGLYPNYFFFNRNCNPINFLL